MPVSEVSRILYKKYYSMGVPEILIFFIILSTILPGSNALTPTSFYQFSKPISSFFSLSLTYYSYSFTALASFLFMEKVIALAFAGLIQNGEMSSYLALPQKKKSILLSTILMGILIPYAVASLSSFFSMYLLGLDYSAMDVLYVSLLYFPVYLLIGLATLLVALLTRNIGPTFLFSFVIILLIGMAGGIGVYFWQNYHNFVPFIIAGIIFPPALLIWYDYLSVNTPYSGNHAFTGLFFISVYANLAITLVLLALSYWYWTRKFET